MRRLSCVASMAVLLLLVAGAVAVDEEDNEHPAATMAAVAATATKPNLGSGLNVPWPCEREGHRPPRPLSPRSIPYPFRHNAVGYADVGHPYDTRVLPG